MNKVAKWLFNCVIEIRSYHCNWKSVINGKLNYYFYLLRCFFGLTKVLYWCLTVRRGRHFLTYNIFSLTMCVYAWICMWMHKIENNNNYIVRKQMKYFLRIKFLSYVDWCVYDMAKEAKDIWPSQYKQMFSVVFMGTRK